MSSAGSLSELDALRSQVADLSRQLAERDRSSQHQREQSDLLRAIVEGTATETGEAFFLALVTHLTSVLRVKYALIGEVQGDHIKKVRTLAVSAGDTLIDNFEYDLDQTPCATALTQTSAYFARDLQATFPQFQLVADLGAESYCAVPLRTKGGAAMGLLVVMDTKPLQQGDDLQALLEVFAPRVAAEYERRRAEQERVQALADLHNVIETIPDIVFALDTQGNVVKWNRRLGYVTGYSPEELLNKPALAFVPPEEQARTAAAIQRVFMEGYAELEGHLLTKERRLIPYHWAGALLKNSHGEPVGITGIGRDVSGRNLAEAALRASEERYRALYDETPTMYFTLAMDGTVLSVNRFGAEQLGYQVEELIGHSVLSLFPECDKEAVVSSLSECLANPEETRHWAFRKVRKDGSIVWVRETVRAGRSSTGETVVLITCEDITERRLVEEALKKTEQYNRILFENSPIGLVLCQLDGTIVDCNQRYSDILDRGCSDILGKTYWDLTSKKYDEQALVAMETLCRTGRFGPYDKEYIHADGRLVPVRLFGSLIEKDGELLMICSVEDITERKRAEEAFRSSQEKLRQALQASNTGLWDWNTETKEVLFSREWKGQIGYEEADLEDTFESWETHLHPDDHDRAIAFVQAYLADPIGEYRQQFRLRHKDGTYRWIEARASFVTEPDGRRVRLLGSHTDITERKRAEETQYEMHLALTNAMPGIARLDSQGRYLSINAIYAGALGYDPDELIGEAWPLSVFLDDRPKAESAYAAMLREGKGEFEVRALRKDGSTFWTQVLMVKIADSQGRHLGHHCFMRDITKRKQFEAMRARQYEALQANFNMTVALARASSLEEVYEQGIDGVQRALKVDRASILLFDGEGVMRFKASRGLSKEYLQAVEGHSPWSREAVDPSPICVADIEEDPSTEKYREVFRAERIRALGFIPLWSSDGLLGKFMLYHHSPHQFTEEEIQVAQMIAGHIAFMIQRKRAETALARREQELRIVLESLPVGVWFTDAQGKMVLGNPAAREIWAGVKQVSLLNAEQDMQWWEEAGPLAKPHRWAITRVLVTGESVPNDVLEITCLDGSRKTIRNSVVPVRGTDGGLQGAILLNEDITALRQAQEAFKLTQFSVDQAIEGFFWISSEGRILNVNDAACRILEYTREELTSMTVPDIDPNFPSEAWPAHWNELKQKGSLTFESKHWSKTGRVLDTEVTVNYLQYEGKEYSCAIMRNIAERKRAEAALSQSEERYRSLVNDAPIGIFVNEGGRFVYANREFQRIVNATKAEQLLGMPVLDRIAPEFHAVVKDRIQQLTENGQPVPTLDEQYVRLDGLRVDVAVTAIPTFLNGTPVMQVLVLDIAERKRAEEALRLAKFSVERAADAVYWIDRQAMILDVNEAASLMLGYSKDELFAMTFHDLNPDFKVDSWPAVWAETQQRGTMVFETTHRAKNGRLIPIEVSVNYLFYEGKEYHCAFVRDITERKQAEKEQCRLIEDLTRSQQHFQSLFNWTPSAIGINTVAEGRFVDVNEGFISLTGYTREEIIGRTTLELGLWADPTERETVLRDIREQGRLHNREGRLRTKSGSIRALMVSVESIQLGSTLCLIYLIHDITERKHMEDALRLRERELQIALQERERISQDLHDGILQSLFGVGLNLEVTKSLMSAKTRKTAGGSLDKSIDQLNRVMREIRNFIAGLGPDPIEGKDLSAALQSMLTSLTENQPTRVRLAVEKRAVQAVSAEQSIHLFRVIQEAVSNCIRHGFAQEARVSLKMLKQGVRLSIRDNGRGFNQDIVKAGGYGLRNMAARAQKISGRFTVLSKENEGTRIILDLPKEASNVSR